MDIDEIKKIQIPEIMSRLGHTPVSRSRGGTQLLYRSPFRDDRKPSFSVCTTRNIWNDFGTGKAGDVIDFAVAMGGGCSFREAVSWLEDIMGCPATVNPANDWKNCPPDTLQAVIEDTKVEPLKHNALIKYLGSRNIPPDIGMKYCKEVHYTVGVRRFFGLCFMNILGGMEIRSASFKGCHGVKAPSVIQVSKERRTPACCVFEGFMDFLSYMTLWERGDESIVQDVPCDCIVTNSTSLVRKAIPFIDVYQQAFCYFDNDDAGRDAFWKIWSAIGGRAYDMSGRYLGSNDLNDALMYNLPSGLV
jgi:hypothetical protein